jgi:hypothetical protein
MPSKLLGIMATGKSLLCLANRESSVCKVVEKNNIGYVLKEDEYHKLSSKILEIMECGHKELKESNARVYVEKNYRYENVMKNLKYKIITV